MKLSSAQRMMLGIAVGDALGREYENVPGKDIQIDSVPGSYAGDTGTYTDDTQMSIAIAGVMAEGLPFEPEVLGEAFVRAYRRDRRDGYSRETRAILKGSRSGAEFINFMTSEEKSERMSDGAAMRAVPIGLFEEPNEVARNAKINSEVSHGHPHAVAASIGIALASHYFYYDIGPGEGVIPYILDNAEMPDPEISGYLEEVDSLKEFDPEAILGEYADFGPPYIDAHPVLGAVLYITKEFSCDPAGAIVETLSLGGDADTTLSMVLGIIMTANPGYELPGKLFTCLENGMYGRDYILRLGRNLGSRYPDHHGNIT